VEPVGTAVTLMKSMMAEVVQLCSVEQHITAAIKNNIDFERIRFTGCSVHHQQIVNGSCLFVGKNEVALLHN
jgi:hypothetical protein